MKGRRPLNEPIIKIRDVYRRFGTLDAVAGVDLDVYPGEVVVIIGPMLIPGGLHVFL